MRRRGRAIGRSLHASSATAGAASLASGGVAVGARALTVPRTPPHPRQVVFLPPNDTACVEAFTVRARDANTGVPLPKRTISSSLSTVYMGLTPGQKLEDVKVDKVFVGSCTNGRIEDLRAVAAVLKGKKVAAGVGMLIVPGSGLVKHQAEEEGLDKIFLEAGAEWREPSCSMCLGMNPDILQPGERCASTSNRNFEGRQGRGARTHLVSPAMAAAAAITGHLTDVRKVH